jgi:aspartyl aminopeptidase
MLSADNAHACHPNQGAKADPTNRPVLNKGIVLKHHGSQKYSTDAYSAAYVKKLCRDNDIPIQTYANRSDIAGGSTLGNLAMAQVSMAAADIGLPQLAMHSAYETAGVQDMEYLVRLAKAFYNI